MIWKAFARLLAVASIVLVLVSVDAAKCGQHEILVPIAPTCEQTCNGDCSVRSKRYVICQRPVCICKPGFVRSGGQCVPFNSCKPRTAPPPCPTTCPPVVTTTCPPVTTPCPTTTPAPCSTPAPPVPCLVVTNPPCQPATRPCGSCGAAVTLCPCRPIVRVTFS